MREPEKPAEEWNPSHRYWVICWCAAMALSAGLIAVGSAAVGIAVLITASPAAVFAAGPVLDMLHRRYFAPGDPECDNTHHQQQRERSMSEIKQPKQKITFGKFENVDMRVGRVVSAPMAEGTRHPSRVIKIDLGPLGVVQSIGQYGLIDEQELVGRNVVVCINLGSREMGPYVSEALLLGAPHPANPEGQAQATPLWVDSEVVAGSSVY